MKANQFGTLSETPKAIEMVHRASDTAVDGVPFIVEGAGGT
jgi:enolase